MEDKINITFLLKTPFIYFLIAAIVLSLLITSVKIEKKLKIPYFLLPLSVGIVICLIITKYLILIETFNLICSFLISLIALFVLISIRRFLKLKLFSIENIGLITTHIFDASTTYIAIKFFNYGEQHVLANFAISIFGLESLFVLKLMVILPLLYLIDREIKNSNEKNFIKFAIFVLGFAPGMRNLLTVSTVVI
jgi:uncharacterized membrane protein